GRYLKHWNDFGNFDNQKIHQDGSAIVRDRLKGLYAEYYNILKQNGFTSDPGGYNDVFGGSLSIDENYFPFLRVASGPEVGVKVRETLSSIFGFSNIVVDDPDLISSYMSQPNDVKLEGMVWVGNRLEAVTGNRNNLLFKGATVIGRNENAFLGIKGVNNTTFMFDSGIIEMLESMEAPSFMIPTFYKQYDRIYTGN
ncbi:MAG: hypothetical protein NZM44_03430, partial [Candidatus Calescibacterium sp.]|nr:hypothetical protein [Candidatus Calescibacterium sp.]